MYFSHEYVHLAIRKIRPGDWVQLMCLKTTADYYGWSETFPDISTAKAIDSGDGLIQFPTRKRPRRTRALRLYISREKAHKKGYPRGLTNCFRVSRNVCNRDLVAMAHATTVDFGWMNDVGYNRVTRDEWLAREIPSARCA